MVRNVLPEELGHLHELAINLHWSWDTPTRELFRAIDSEIWDRDPNPLALLAATSSQRLAELAADSAFVQGVYARNRLHHASRELRIFPPNLELRPRFRSIQVG